MTVSLTKGRSSRVGDRPAALITISSESLLSLFSA